MSAILKKLSTATMILGSKLLTARNHEKKFGNFLDQEMWLKTLLTEI